VRGALLLALPALALAACGGDVRSAETRPPAATPTPTPAAQAKVAGKNCSEVGDLTAAPERTPPDDVAVPGYVHVYKSEGTKRFYAVLDGTPDQLASRRDDAQNELIQNYQYAALDTDDRPGVASEGSLEGEKHAVTLVVTPLCDGKLGIRYTVTDV
jgi:hypothetical protein